MRFALLKNPLAMSSAIIICCYSCKLMKYETFQHISTFLRVSFISLFPDLGNDPANIEIATDQQLPWIIYSLEE